ncbi:methyltransferase [Candidatus Woesearchaeota archaeon]|nr:methyltransferase [Candidatus Woesearchaeota archaeon]
MKILILTNPGLEAISAQEIKVLFNLNCELSEGKLLCDVIDEKVLELCYMLRTINRVIVLIQSFSFDKTPLEKFESFKTEQSFKINGQREGTHFFTSFELSNLLAKKIQGSYNPKQGIIHYYFIVENNIFYFGIDISGFDLGKRAYRLFLGPDSLRGNIAASLLLIAEYSANKKIIDPFCRTGIIPIEAALIAKNKSPHFFNKNNFAFTKIKLYDNWKNVLENIDRNEEETNPFIYAIDPQFKNIASSKKNANLAGVNKIINFSRKDLYWLDLKFNDQSIDCIITQPPNWLKNNDKTMIKLYSQFFEQSKKLLSPKGIIVLYIHENKKQIIELALGFKLKKEIKIKQGKEDWHALQFVL